MAGFGGSVAAMQQSLKLNKALLNKHVPYATLKKYWEQEAKMRYELSFKELSEDQLKIVKAEIKQKLQADRNARKRLLLGFCVLGAILLFWVGMKVFEAPLRDLKFEEMQEWRQKEIEDNLRYKFYVEDGYQRLKLGEWYNASFQFEKAISAKPGAIEGYVGKIRMWQKQCEVEGESCDKTARYLMELKGSLGKEKWLAIKAAINSPQSSPN